jgi:hypothetical protein
MAKRIKPKDVDLQNKKECDKLTDRMRTAFMRVTVTNEIKDPEMKKLYGDTFTYTEEHIKNFLKRYDCIEYCYILHENDVNELGEIEQPHYHICMRYVTDSSFSFKVLKKAFPFGMIQVGRYWNNMVQYLIHKNDKKKTPHEVSEIVTNIDSETLKFYLESEYEAPKKAEERVLNQILRLILDGLGRKEYFMMLDNNRDELLPIHKKYSSKINEFFKIQKTLLPEKTKNRNIQTIFIEGAAGSGKTAYAVSLAESQDMTYYVSGSSNDVMEGYDNEDVLIIDDGRSSTFKYADFLKIIDPHVSTAIQSRYNNKTFVGEMIIITSYVPLHEWYRKCTNGDGMDKDYGNSSARQQLDRRINTVIKVDAAQIKVYYHDSQGEDTLLYRLPNAAYLLKDKTTAPKRIERDILLKAADHLAKKLNVSEEYEQFKDVDFLKAPESKITDTDEWVYRSDGYVDMEKFEKTIIKKE